MKNDENNGWIFMCVFSLLIALSNFIPLLGPILLGFLIGYNTLNWSMIYNSTDINCFKMIIIGCAAYFAFVGLFVSHMLNYYISSLIWVLMLAGFAINTALALLFYFLGKKIFSIKLGKELEEV